MTAPALRCALDARASLGECAIWSVDDQALWWVDINAPSLNRFDPQSGRNVAIAMPSSVGSFALRARGGFVIALRDGLWLADERGRLEQRVAPAPYDPSHHRFNDGRCDRQGRFLVGTMNERRDANTAALYRLDRDFSLAVVLDDMMISNGLAFSPDGRTMYHADTPTRIVHAYDYHEGNEPPTNRRPFARWTAAGDRPDGACVDSEGCYWSAFYHGGKVVRVSPQGEVLGEFAVPAMCPTMCALGGPDLRTLFVTSARQQRSDEELARLPQSGGIFTMRVDVPGLPEPCFLG
jgi:sugar lactone lactonase YvrE